VKRWKINDGTVRLTTRFESPDLEHEVLTRLNKLTALVPSWVRDVRVESARLDENNVCVCAVMHEYRSLTISIDHGWFDQPEATRFQQLAHELVHVLTEPIAGVARDNARRLDERCEGSPYEERLTALVESVVQDLSFVFADLLGIDLVQRPEDES